MYIYYKILPPDHTPSEGVGWSEIILFYMFFLSEKFSWLKITDIFNLKYMYLAFVDVKLCPLISKG